jgi:hypothetical protein
VRRRTFHPGVWVALLVFLASCQTSTPPLDGHIAIPLARLDQASVATVSGTVLAPAGYSADTDAASRRIASLQESPLAATAVMLATLKGDMFTGIEPIRSDAQGHFTFKGIPSGLRLIVMAKAKDHAGKHVVLKAVVQTREGETHQDVSVAATLVTAALLKNNFDETRFSQEGFQAAVDQLASQLSADSLPDLANDSAIAPSAQTLIDGDCQTQTAFEALAGTGDGKACSPSPTPGSGGGGIVYGGGAGGGGAPAPHPATKGSFTANIQIQDGPVLPATPSPTPTPSPSPVPSPSGT